MNIEIKELQFTLIEKIEEGIIISSESHEVENQYWYDTLPDKICGMEMESVL